MLCPFCNSQNASTASVCQTCGAPLSAPANGRQPTLSPPSFTPLQPPPDAVGERNHHPNNIAHNAPNTVTAAPGAASSAPTSIGHRVSTNSQAMEKGAEVRVAPTLKAKLREHDDTINALAFLDTRTLVSGSADGTIRLWDSRAGKSKTTYKLPSKAPGKTKVVNAVRAVATAPDGRMLASGYEDGQLHLWDVPGSGVSCRLEGHLSRVSALAFTSDSGRLISSSGDGAVVSWNVKTGKPIRTLISGSEGITALALTPDDLLLAIASDNGGMLVCDMRTQNPEWSQDAHDFWTTALAFAPNGNGLASGGYDQIVRVWAAQTGFKLQAMSGHTGCVGALAFAPIVPGVPGKGSGRLLASGSYDGSVRLWDSWTGTLLHELADHSTPIASLAFAPDGSTLATTARDEIWLWSL